jgi:putative peptide zinc metalloprotease protein
MLKLLREDVTSSFSDLWYKLGPTRPRLSSHAQVAKQSFGEQTAYIVEDPASGQYYRVTDSAYFFIGLLDGRRTVDQAWEACNAQLGDIAPTQRECVDLLSRLQLYGLLSGDLPLAADMVELRHREVQSRRIQRRTGRGVSMTIPLINPEPFLERSGYLLRVIFSKWGAVVWIAVVGFALLRVIQHRDALTDNLNGVLDPNNLVWLGLVFLLLRAWHEFGHAAACKAMGARCTEIGLMLIALVLPFPYCDTSAAWRLPEVWKRVVVSAGGMIFEIFVAALAAIAWSFMGKDDAGLLRTMCYNTMLVSGVTTLIFNLNPLLRYDGYYILSDITGSANLAMRAQELLKFFTQRYIFRVGSARPPMVRSTGELALLATYGLLSLPYRILVVVSIVLVLWSNPKYLTLGAALAVAAGAAWIVWPVLQGIGYLLLSPQLIGRRLRAISLTGAAALVIGALVGLIPMPAAGYATGTVEPKVAEPLRPSEDGFVELVHVRAGDFVNAGDPVITLHNAEVIAALGAAQAVVDQAQAQWDASISGPIADRVQAETHLQHMQINLARAKERADALIVRARTAGRIVPGPGLGPEMDRLTGTFVQKGSLVGTVASTDQLLVRCVVADRDEGYIFRDKVGEQVRDVRASIRVRGSAGDELAATVTRRSPAGSRRVTDEALTTTAGGDVLVEPSEGKKPTTVAPQWVVEVEPRGTTAEQLAAWKPGLRAKVRFGVPAEPLAQQWWRTFRQYLSDKASV